MHVMLAGRAGYEYESTTSIDENTGKEKIEFNRSGTKMKAEGDFSYEPNLLLELNRVRPDDESALGYFGMEGLAKKYDTASTKWLHIAEVLKDKAQKINGHNFVNPTLNDIMPHLLALNLGGAHQPVDLQRNSQGLFGSPEQRREVEKRREILLEEISAQIISIYGAGGSAKIKEAKVALIKQIFGTGSWTQVSNLPIDSLERGFQIMKTFQPPASVEQLNMPAGEVNKQEVQQ
jgi:hypothetical protein